MKKRKQRAPEDRRIPPSCRGCLYLDLRSGVVMCAIPVCMREDLEKSYGKRKG